MLVAKGSYNFWGIRRADHMSPLYWLHDRATSVSKDIRGREASSRLVSHGPLQAVALRILFIYYILAAQLLELILFYISVLIQHLNNQTGTYIAFRN